jgi:hypothetical protein
MSSIGGREAQQDATGDERALKLGGPSVSGPTCHKPCYAARARDSSLSGHSGPREREAITSARANPKIHEGDQWPSKAPRTCHEWPQAEAMLVDK